MRHNHKACLSAGFFYIINHGVDPAFLAEVFAESKKFFSLPLEEKMKVLRSKHHRGYTPFRAETLNPVSQSEGTFFFNLNYDYMVECLPTCCSKVNPPKFPPISTGGHLMNLNEQAYKKASLAMP